MEHRILTERIDLSKIERIKSITPKYYMPELATYEENGIHTLEFTVRPKTFRETFSKEINFFLDKVKFRK